MSEGQEIKQVDTRPLIDRCRADLVNFKRAEVCLGTYRFNTDDSTDLDYDDYEIAIARAKLEAHGWWTDTSIRMDKTCRKVILIVCPPPDSKTVVGVVTRK